MSADVIVIDGEAHVTLERVAEIYRVDVVWLRAVNRRGLLGGVDNGAAVCVAVARFDHVATIVRLHHLYDDLDLLAQAMARLGSVTPRLPE